MLEFEELSYRVIFIDFNSTRLEINARIVQSKVTLLPTHATEAANRDTPYFALSSLFFECTLSLNGEKISTTNANFAHKSFIDFEFSNFNDPKKHGWLVMVIPMKKINQLLMEMEELMERSAVIAASNELNQFGKISREFMSCDKLLLSGVTLRVSLRRSLNNFVPYMKMQLNNTKFK